MLKYKKEEERIEKRGEKKGLKKGVKIGVEIGKQIAPKDMKRVGIDVKIISKISGLTEDQIEKL